MLRERQRTKIKSGKVLMPQRTNHAPRGKVRITVQDVYKRQELAFACENLGYPQEDILKRIDRTVSDYHNEDLMGRSVFALSGGEKDVYKRQGTYGRKRETTGF